MPKMAQNVTFISKNDGNDKFCIPRQLPLVNAFGADFLHITIFAILQKDEMTARAGRPAAQTMNYRFSFFCPFSFFCLSKKKVSCEDHMRLCADHMGVFFSLGRKTLGLKTGQCFFPSWSPKWPIRRPEWRVFFPQPSQRRSFWLQIDKNTC